MERQNKEQEKRKILYEIDKAASFFLKLDLGISLLLCGTLLFCLIFKEYVNWDIVEAILILSMFAYVCNKVIRADRLTKLEERLEALEKPKQETNKKHESGLGFYYGNGVWGK